MYQKPGAKDFLSAIAKKNAISEGEAAQKKRNRTIYEFLWWT